MSNQRHTRYQGAIVRDHHILLIMHREHSSGRSYWVIPGGGMEPGETEEDTVRREMQEETSLTVRVDRLLLDDAGIPEGIYRRLKTYLCTPLSGEAAPGYEPETEAAALYRIDQVAWVDLRDPSGWSPDIAGDRFTYPTLLRIRSALGYPAP